MPTSPTRRNVTGRRKPAEGSRPSASARGPTTAPARRPKQGADFTVLGEVQIKLSTRLPASGVVVKNTRAGGEGIDRGTGEKSLQRRCQASTAGQKAAMKAIDAKIADEFSRILPQYVCDRTQIQPLSTASQASRKRYRSSRSSRSARGKPSPASTCNSRAAQATSSRQSAGNARAKLGQSCCSTRANRRQSVAFAKACAKRVLSRLETNPPQDSTPHRCPEKALIKDRNPADSPSKNAARHTRRSPHPPAIRATSQASADIVRARSGGVAAQTSSSSA